MGQKNENKIWNDNAIPLRTLLSAIKRCASLICPTGKICSIFPTIAPDPGLFRCQIACA
jgi:hypothetical protein